jgi:hypothetical protein
MRSPKSGSPSIGSCSHVATLVPSTTVVSKVALTQGIPPPGLSAPIVVCGVLSNKNRW